MARKTAAERRESLRKRQQQSINDKDKVGLGKASVLNTSGIENLNYYKPKHGRDKNIIDILPFEITTEWYQNLRLPSGRQTGLEVGDIDYKLELPIHKNVGPERKAFICLRLAFGKKCPICEERSEEFEKPEEDQDKDKLRELKPRWRDFYNIYDYDEGEKHNQLWDDFSYHMFEKYLLDEAGEITFSDLEEGKTLEIKFREKELGTVKFLEASNIEFVDRDIYEETILDETFKLDAMVHIPTYDEVLNAHLGIEDEDEPVKQNPSVKDDPLPDDEVIKALEEPVEEDTVEIVEVTTEDVVEEVDEPPFDVCPDKLNFGVDFQSEDECNTCNEKAFEACSEAYEKQKQQESVVEEKKEETPAKSRSRVKRTTEQQKPDKKEETKTPTRVRRR